MNVCERREDRVSREYYALASIFIADVHLQLRYIRVSYYQYVVPFDVIYYCHYRYLYTRCVLYARYVAAPTRKGCSAFGRVTVVCIRTSHIQLWISKIFSPSITLYSFSVLDLFFGFDNNVTTCRKGAFKMWRTARDLRFFLPRAVYLL